MSLALYIDHHIHAAVTEGLRRAGLDVVTALDDGSADVPDERLLERAAVLGRVVYTQDADFLKIAHEWQAGNHEFAGVIYSHQLQITVGQAIRDLELVARVLTPTEVANQIIYLPL